MTSRTATESAYERAQRDDDERRLHWMHRVFAEKYAPDDLRARDVFGADLAMLLRQVQIDAQRPFHEAVANQMARSPMPPIFLKSDDHISERIFNKAAGNDT